METLRPYSAPFPSETAQIQMGILTLSRGRLESLPELTECARDYRNILAWSSEPPLPPLEGRDD